MIAMPMPASPQNSSSTATGSVSPESSLHRVEHEVDPVEADLGGLLDDRVRELLALVPLDGRRAHDALGEVVDPLLDLQLVLVESSGELCHGG